VGGDAGTRLVDEGNALYVTPAWLPDGSGFVYTIDHQIYHYDLATSQNTLLANFYGDYVFNPSVSPDGRYVVFEWQTSLNPVQKDLWIMDRQNPVEMWALTNDGHSTDPDWSRQDPKASNPLFLPVVLKP
jgi:Tol biopolymer transport system component